MQADGESFVYERYVYEGQGLIKLQSITYA